MTVAAFDCNHTPCNHNRTPFPPQLSLTTTRHSHHSHTSCSPPALPTRYAELNALPSDQQPSGHDAMAAFGRLIEVCRHFGDRCGSHQSLL